MTDGFDKEILDMNGTAPEPEDYTGEDGADAASPKKPISRRASTFSGVTATRRNVTASGQNGRSGRPGRPAAGTGRKWIG